MINNFVPIKKKKKKKKVVYVGHNGIKKQLLHYGRQKRKRTTLVDI